MEVTKEVSEEKQHKKWQGDVTQEVAGEVI
jgi:hypothetical protein